MQVNILNKKRILDAFFKVDEITLQHDKFDGTMTEPIKRLNFERGDSVAAVVYNPQKDTVILTQQFRLPAYMRLQDSDSAMLIETAAGMIDANETSQDAIIREVREELGFRVDYIKLLFSFFLSPGGSSERIHLFYIEVTDQVEAGGGVALEYEDIKFCVIVEFRRRDVFDMVEKGEIMDAKTIIGLQWLKQYQ